MDQKKFGDFLCYTRKQLGLTQEQLGERLGVTNKTVSRWETGKYMPDLDKLQELSSILQLSINELLAGERIEDAAQFAKIAEENVITLLSKDPAFSVEERIKYFKKKWRREHKMQIVVCVLLWGLLFYFGIYGQHNVIIAALFPILGIGIFIYMRNQMMIYIEKRAFDGKGD